ncbi:MAG: hypothetical protein PVG91_07650, partial [Gammaproteobacteria bacterium]
MFCLLLALSAVAPVQALDDGITDYLTVPAGSYVIDMGQPQTIATGVKPYGLVFDLVTNDRVPLWWVIDPNKGKDGIDFASYRGGPFVIPAEYVNASVLSTIATWQAKGVVVDGPTPEYTNVPVYDVIRYFPRTILDLQNGSIAEGYFQNAEIPSNYYQFDTPANLNSCQDLYAMPHADPAWSTHNNLLAFNESRGFIWAACHAVSVLEQVVNPLDPTENLIFLSNTGLIDFGDHDDGTPPYSYAHHNDPVMQLLGPVDGATTNGSEQIFVPNGSGWRSTTRIAAFDPDHPDILAGNSPGEAAVIAYGRGHGVSSNGYVMYEAGHSHAKGSGPDNVAAQRAFLNFVLLAGIERRVDVTTNIPSQIDAGETVSLTVTPLTGSGFYTYEWNSTCGGTFSHPFSQATDFTAPETVPDLDCVVRVFVTDTCSRDSFDAAPILVNGRPLSNLSITKIDSADPVAVGADYSYTLQVDNAGPSDAENVTITDTLPPELTFVSASPQCSWDGTTLTCALGTLAAGGTDSVTVTVTAPGSRTTVSNTASVSTSIDDPDLADNSVTETTEVLPEIDLAITKNGPPAPVEFPDSFSYTVRVTNNGPLDATNVAVTDVLAPELDFVSASGTGWACNYNAATRTVSCTRNTLANGATAPAIVIAVTPNSVGDIDNTASVSSPDFFESAAGDNSDTTSTNVFTTVNADLGIIKNVDKDDADIGNDVIFTFTVTNYGPDDATGVAMSDPVDPAIYEYRGIDSAPTQGTITYNAGSGLTWTIGSLAAGASATVGVQFRLLVDTTGNPITNTASVSGNEPDLNAANDSDSATIEDAVKESDLGVVKTDSADPIPVGGTYSYSLRVTNLGPEDLNDQDKPLVATAPPTLVDALPAGTSFNGIAVTDKNGDPTATWICTYAAGPHTVTCIWDGSNDNNFNNGDFYDFAIDVQAPANPGVVSNTATISYTQTTLRDNNTQNNSDTELTTIDTDERFADLTLQKNVNNEGADIGNDVDFTFTVTNNGPDTASGVFVTDPIDSAIYEFRSIQSGPSQGSVSYDLGTGLTWNVGTLANGATATVVVRFRILVDTTGNPITNTATATLNETDPNTANNTDSAIIEDGTIEADLGVAKSDSVDPVAADTAFSYSLTVTNFNVNDIDKLEQPAETPQVPTVVDVLPDGVDYVGYSVTDKDGNPSNTFICAHDAGSNTVTCTWDPLDDNKWEKTHFYTIVIDVRSPNFGGTLSNTASISYVRNGFVDNNANNDRDTETTQVTPANVDAAITKVVDNATPALDDEITFTVTATNNTPGSTSHVRELVVEDVLPAGLSYVSHSGAGSYNPFNGLWTIGDLDFGSSAAIDIVASVDVYGDYTNTATVLSLVGDDTDAANDSDFADVSVSRADLSLAKLADGVESATVNVGDAVTFELTLTNAGPFDATGVLVEDTLPPGLSYISHDSSGNGSYDAGTGIWSGVTVPAAPGSNTATLQIVATVTATGSITNTASISGADQGDPDDSNNSDTASVTGIAADIQIEKTVTPAEANPGESVTFTVTVTNLGDDDATNLAITDPPPAGLVFDTVTPSVGSYAGSTWTIGDLSVGATATLTIDATVSTTGTLTNVASVQSLDQGDPTPGNDSDSASVLSNGISDLFVVKTADPTTVEEFGTVVFTIALDNNGPNDASGVVLNDTLPAGLTYVSHTASAGSYDTGSGDWTVGTLANGDSAQLSITVTGDSLGTFTNTVAVSALDQGDPDETNDESQAVVEVVETPPSGANGVPSITAMSSPGDTLDVSVVDRDLSGAGTTVVTVTNDVTGESESVTLAEDAGNPGTFNGTLATTFGTTAGTDNDGTLNTQAGDTVTVAYFDALTVTGGTATVIDVGFVNGGADGTVSITPTSVPGDTLDISVTDADLAGAGTVLVTAVNDVTGESEAVTLTEDAGNPGTFDGTLGTTFGTAAGTDDDGTLNTQAGDTVTVTYVDALDVTGASADRTAIDTVGGGADGSVSITPTSVPGDTLDISVTDADLAGAGSIVVVAVNDVTGESEAVTLIEDVANPGTFNGTVATTFGTTAGADDDGTVNTQAGDTVTASYTDALSAAGATVDRTAVDTVGGGADGTVSITATSVPGDTLNISVTDADLAGDGTIVVTVVNDVTGESEAVTLTEDAGNPGTFDGTLATTFGTAAGVDDDGTLNTQAGDTVTVSYADDLTAAGGTATQTATGTVGGGADGIVSITPTSVPGDTLDLSVTDADLAGAGTVAVTVVNDVTGESEAVTLTEDAGNPGTFDGTVVTIFGSTAGTDDDGTVNTQAGDTVTVSYTDALTAAGGSATRTATDTVGGGADGTVSITPTSVPGDTLDISVTDADLAGAGTVTVTVVSDVTAESEVITLTEDAGNPGTFDGTLATNFGTAAGTDDDGALNTQAGDTVTVSYTDALTSAGGTATRTATDTVGGGADGTVTITPTSVPGDTLDISVTDADLAGAGIVVVTVVNDVTGESEAITLTEDAGNPGTFDGTLATTFGTAAGTDDDGTLNTQSGDTVTVSYSDDLTAVGGTEARTATDAVGGGADGTVSITPTSVPGDTLDLSVTDADLAGAGTVVVTVVNDVTGESEAVTLTEDGGNPGTFDGTIVTTFGTTAGADDDGVLNTQAGDTVTVSYTDALTAAGGSATRTATDTV